MENGLLTSNNESPKGALDYEQMVPDMESRLPPKLKEAWDRIMAAGMKFLFDKSTNPMVNDYLDGEGDIATKIGEGAAGLITFLYKESNESMPKELIIPSGMALMVEVVKYIQKSKTAEVTAADFGQAVQVYLEKVLGAFGATMDQMEQTLEVAASRSQGAQEQGPQQPPMMEGA